MKRRLIDTSFLIAFTSPRDKHHKLALALYAAFGTAQLFTTEEVLVEYLNHFCAYGSYLRKVATQAVEFFYNDARIVIFPQTSESFQAGLNLYRSRGDKEYSLTDCISMSHMRDNEIDEVLTSDRHFEQEGFTILLKDD